MSISDSIFAIKERIKNSALRVGRNPDDIKLVAVTKAVGIDKIKEAMDAGLRIFGENRVQEALKKVTSDALRVTPPIPPLDKGGIEWHLIGHLQKNKAKYAVELFDLIHTVDSIPLADELDKQAKKTGKTQRILIQAKLSEEEAKHGADEKELLPLLERIGSLTNLKLEGLMTMPPFFDDPEMARPYFRRLREIRDAVNSSLVTRHSLLELSMGMSHDFEIAVEEGATMVRIGSAIFANGS
ncbi:MAG: YggS family pyridoxal phosphate-dependent enzyme [Nitrospirae bacterium]|nr:YggS family pyridoxal phosphate-dependent enzyme [Nitrospirota bacterium]